MRAVVYPKSGEAEAAHWNADSVELTAASVVILPVGPEAVVDFHRRGDDLVVTLADGRTLCLQGFFTVTPEGRHDLVFEDEAGVTWWAQYGESWTGFDIAEIDRGMLGLAAAAVPAVAGAPQVALAALGAVGTGAGLALTANTPPVGRADPVTTAEDTPVSGLVTGRDEDDDRLTYSLRRDAEHGSVVVNRDGSYTYTPDPDYNGPDSFRVTVNDGNGGTDVVRVEVTVTPVNDPPVGSADRLVVAEDSSGDGAVEASDVDGDSLTYTLVAQPDNGTVTLNADGSYTYTPDADFNGEDSFDVLVDDGNGGTTTVTVPITVTPENDAATITGTATGAVTEAGGIANATAGTPSASGTLTVTDIDAGEAVFAVPASLAGIYGTFTFDAATGDWTYTLDDTRAATQALTAGETETDELVVSSADGSATETITVTITGANDVPVVTDDTGAVTEDADGGTGTLTTSGQVTITDPDAGESTFDVASLAPSGTPMGALTIDAAGVWSYAVDTTLAGVQSLALGETLDEVWTVTSADGTATSTITVTITGTNDAPDISGEATGAVTEDTALTATGSLADGDVDILDVMTWSVVGGTGTYGTLSVDASGDWTYALDNTHGDVQALRNGESLTETLRIRATDNHGAYDEQVVTITINGTNDAPTIAAGGDVTGGVTELVDGHADEGTRIHSETGSLEIVDVDATDAHGVSAAPLGSDYLGTFTPVVNATTGAVDWTFTVPDAALDALGEGDTLTQSYLVTVTDIAGATGTATVTLTLTGANDRPEPEDDASIIAAGGPSAVLDVTQNDADDDAGEAATLRVTSVEGLAIVAGGSVTLLGNMGTVALALDGQTLTYTPGSAASGEVSLDYVVNDGSGAANATAGATWVVNLAQVTITDDASRAGATTPDGVLADIDDLGNVRIGGHAAPGGTVTSLTISDGTDSVVVPAGSITVDADGNYAVTAALGELDDGTLTVTAIIEDAEGNPVTVTDTILKDTVTAVVIDPVLIEEGTAPTITGSGEADADIELTVDGDTYRTIVGSDGRWSVTLPAPLGTEETDISVEAIDEAGNRDTDARSVSGLEVADAVPGEPEDIAVSETALTGGTAEGSGADAASSTFRVTLPLAELGHVVIGGGVASGSLSGGTQVSAAELSAASTSPVDVATAYGTLTITGFDNATGTISYTYTLTGATSDHDAASANDILRETIQVAAVGTDSDTRVSTIVVGIEDDAPEAPVADSAVTVVEGGSAAGSATTGDNLLANDTLGADGGRVHQIFFTDRDGDPASATVPEGASAEVDTRFGTLTVASGGAWSYTPLPDVDHRISGDGTAMADDFSYSTIDDDGDVSPATATQSITVTDTVPVFGTPENALIDEANIATGTAPDASEVVQTGSLDLTPGADDHDVVLTTTAAPTGLSSGGTDIIYALSGDGHQLIAHTGDASDPVFTVTLTDPTDADAGYRFELIRPLDHDAATSMDLTFGVEVTDADGDSALSSFTVSVTDDAAADAVLRTIDEDSAGFSVNMSADANGDNTYIAQGGSAITPVSGPEGDVYTLLHGTVTISADGQITYVPAGNFSGEEVFDAVTADDGVSGSTRFTVTVTPVADAPEVAVDAAQVNTLEDTAVALGLVAPVITDPGEAAGPGPRNNETSERIGEISLSGIPVGAILDWGAGSFTVTASGPVTIELTDAGLSETGLSADMSMTVSQFEALTVLPPEHDADNFEVTYSVTSYEVDATGARLAGVAGATSQVDVMVYVEAVTDPATLTFDTGVTAADVENAEAITYAGTTAADVSLNEDMAVDLADMLAASFADLDGSELRSITISNPTAHEISVNGAALAAGASVEIAAAGLSTSTTGFPTILIGGAADFSGDLEGIEITLNAQDVDADGFLSDTGADVDGQPEADTGDNTVILNLYVMPVADDVTVAAAQGPEDSAIAFLAGVSLSDTSAGTGGTELITEIVFDVPAGWSVAAPGALPAGVTATTDLTDGTYTISFTAGDQSGREAYLDGFTITPPAHDSSDADIDLSITTTDTATVNGDVEVSETTRTHGLSVTVTEVPEQFNEDGSTRDTDGNGQPDLTMTPGMTYAAPALEDDWFALSSEGFDLAAGWSNEDASEETFARLTPVLTASDGSEVDATGATFRWSEDGGATFVEAIYRGDPIDVPVDHLTSLEFRAVDDFSGQFEIQVQALTVDYDDDGPIGSGNSTEAVSGSAVLTNVLILPVADDVTISLAARVIGREDTEVPLVIRPTSSDPSEEFNVTISGIPEGSTIVYDGVEQTVTGGVLTLLDFDRTAPMTLLPPEHSNVDFQLTVSAQSVDRLTVDGVLYEDISDAETLTMQVQLRGVADEAVVTTPETVPTYVEADLDAGSDSVALADLVSVAMVDDDGSESLTMQISGLPEGFALTGGTLLTGPNVTGEARVWILREDQLADTDVSVPENFSGDVAFTLRPVTTEDDGASRTGQAEVVRFAVTPSPEAGVTTGVTLVEDVASSIGMQIVHRNGDTDEVLDGLRVRVSDVADADFSLFVGAVAIADAGLSVVDVDGVDYYEMSGAQAGQLSAQGQPHLDGNLGGFELYYRITDPGAGSVADVTGDWTSGRFDIDATPVSDAPTLALGTIDVGGGTGGSASAADVTVDTADTDVTLNMVVSTPDEDGSEHLVRVILDGVPEGVSVEGAELIGANEWLIVLDGADAQPIGAGGLALPIVFAVGPGADGVTDAEIGITVQTQDRPGFGAVTQVLEDRFTWTLTTTFGESGEFAPPQIDVWAYDGSPATEDTPFTLASKIDAQLSVRDSVSSVITITITDLPLGTAVEGMTRTVIEGEVTWTASVVTQPSDDTDTAQARLDALMSSIRITPPENANENNAGPFSFEAVLNAGVAGGGASERASVTPQVQVTPVTDEASVSIVLSAADADGILTESDSDIPMTLTVTNPADGVDGSIVGGEVYLQITGTNGLASGTLTLGGATYTPEAVSGVDGIPDGTYYVVDGAAMGAALDLVFTPDTMTSGTLDVDALVRNIETGAVARTSSGSQSFEVVISNDGAALVSNAPVTGEEASDSSNASLIELNLALALADSDGSERIETVLLSNLPDGFLLYTGTSAGDASLAELAVNAGGGATNTWVLAGDGAAMPAYVGILPPQYWSGTLADLSLSVTSGETSLEETRVDTLAIAPVTISPVANGITLTPTATFGTEGRLVALNLNAAMADAGDATVGAATDGSTETVTLTLRGLGAFAAFYIDGALHTSGVTYDADSDTYTLTGLGQDDVDALGFVQAAAALTDRNAGTSGVQIEVTARTLDGSDTSDAVTAYETVRLTAQLATTGNDSLIWTGQAINGRAGEDTVALRLGEDLTGAELAARLTNIETIALDVAGANAVSGLTPDQVQAMTDADDVLTITGSAADMVSLDGTWMDNGDGTYTGTPTSGEDVILTITGPGVTAPAEGWYTPPPPPEMSFASFGFFGLAGAPDGPEEEGAGTGEGEDTVTYSDVMSSGSADEDLSATLPEERTATRDRGTASADEPAADWSGAPEEDSLSGPVVYEV